VQDFTISVADILGRPGHYRDFQVDRPLPGVHTALAAVDQTPVSARLRAEAVVEGILVTGPVIASANLECARCLARFASPLSLDICELFVAPGHDADDDAYRVSVDQIDLEPMLRDAAILALPLNPLCSPECRGLCARCGTDLNQGPCNCADDDIDPRWADLSALKDRLQRAQIGEPAER
jgi:uncharacterized protein